MSTAHEVIRNHSAAQREPLHTLLDPRTLVGSLWSQRGLIGQLATREISARFRGSALGMVWAVLLPLGMLAVYTFVFSVVLQARFGDGDQAESRAAFALTLFCGLLVFNLMAECVTSAPHLVVSNPGYVKKIVFPLEVLVVVRVAAALVQMLIGLGVLLVAALLLLGGVPWTVLLFPLCLPPLIAWALGLGWVLASLGVYLRDVAQVVGVAVSMLMFLTPIFYPVSRVPAQFQAIMHLNPLTPVVESARHTLLSGLPPAWGGLLLALVGGLLVMQLGFAWFMKTRRGFADVL